MTVTGLELRLPLGQEQLEIGWRQIDHRSSPEPVAEAAKRVRVLAARRGGATTSAQVTVEALEKLLGGESVLGINNYVIDLNS